MVGWGESGNEASSDHDCCWPGSSSPAVPGVADDGLVVDGLAVDMLAVGGLDAGQVHN